MLGVIPLLQEAELDGREVRVLHPTRVHIHPDDLNAVQREVDSGLPVSNANIEHPLGARVLEAAENPPLLGGRVLRVGLSLLRVDEVVILVLAVRLDEREGHVHVLPDGRYGRGLLGGPRREHPEDALRLERLAGVHEKASHIQARRNGIPLGEDAGVGVADRHEPRVRPDGDGLVEQGFRLVHIAEHLVADLDYSIRVVVIVKRVLDEPWIVRSRVLLPLLIPLDRTLGVAKLKPGIPSIDSEVRVDGGHLEVRV